VVSSFMGERKLVDITLDEAVEVLRLAEIHEESAEYELRLKVNARLGDFAQLSYELDGDRHTAANFSDTENAVILYAGIGSFGTHHKIIRYLDERGFDLESLC